MSCGVQGMLLDLDAATLTVYVNGERKGVMVQPPVLDEYGRVRPSRRPTDRLEGPLRWAVDLDPCGSVAIDGTQAPPDVE